MAYNQILIRKIVAGGKGATMLDLNSPKYDLTDKHQTFWHHV